MERLLSDREKDFNENFICIKEKIAVAAEKSGRKFEDINILAATKTVPVNVINHAVSSGIKFIGENRVQEFLDKSDEMSTECEKHFIGRLQTNKIKYLVNKVSCIQSVDSIKLAKEISKIAEKNNSKFDILVEVNVGGEENKGGIAPDQLFEFIDEIRNFPSIKIKGLMTIPPISDNKTQLFSFFDTMRQYYIDICSKKMDNVDMHCLSMGMSDDFEIAIQSGANMIRLGSALFGRRI